jgi:hypothetical protein
MELGRKADLYRMPRGMDALPSIWSKFWRALFVLPAPRTPFSPTRVREGAEPVRPTPSAARKEPRSP